MNCRFCGTALPEDAVFCGECGRPAATGSGRRRASMPKLSLGGRSGAAAALAVEEPPAAFAPEAALPELESADPVVSEPVVAEADVVAADPVATEQSANSETTSCPQCGRVVLVTDVFCGDCGFVLRSPALPAAAVPSPRDTAELSFTGVVVHTAPREIALSGVALVDDVAAEPDVAAEADEEVLVESTEIVTASEVAEPDADEPEDLEPDEPEAVVAEPEPEPGPEPEADVAGPEPEADVADPEPEAPEPEPRRVAIPSVFAPDPAALAVAAAAAAPVGGDAGSEAASRSAKPLRSVPDPFPWGKAPDAARVDLEKTRAVATGPAEERFVLQFSTGESVIVTGAGLIGRNPSSQPGEFVDQLVTIFDAGKSVSKTHLEFGQDSGRFWVSDRYSTNGSTVRQPDLEPKRCEPGRRYFIARGTRVDIGEQFFVVS